MTISLRDYQASDTSRIRDAYARGIRRVLYVLPTGGGKTVVFCHIADGAAKKGTRTGILVHRQELLRQSSKALEFNSVAHGMIAPGYSHSNDHIQIASVQTLARRLKNTLPFKFLVVDEAHHSTAGSWQKIFDAHPEVMVLGVTATPERTDGTGLGEVFQEMIVGPSIGELMDDGYLCRAKVFAPPTQFNLDGIKFRGGDYAREELADRLDRPVIIGDAVEHYQRLCKGQPAIGFCASIDHAEHCAEQFRQAGLRFRSLDGTMSDDYREESIRFLAEGKIDGIMSCDLISEGTDIPVATVGIMQRPTNSTGLHMQQIGRLLRPVYAKGFNMATREGRLASIAASSKPHAIILDHVGNCIKHGLPDEPREWSLAGKKRKNRHEPRYEEEEDIKIRQCIKCFAAHRPSPKCPNCGHVYEVVSRAIEMLPGELVAFAGQTLETLTKNYKTLSEYLRIAKRDGYEETWAHSAFKRQNDKIREARRAVDAGANLPVVPVLGGEESQDADSERSGAGNKERAVVPTERQLSY